MVEKISNRSELFAFMNKVHGSPSQGNGDFSKVLNDLQKCDWTGGVTPNQVTKIGAEMKPATNGIDFA